MILRAAVLALVLMAPALPLRADVAAGARAASTALSAAVTGLEAAVSGREQVAALGETIHAYEAGLATLREAMRHVAVREAALTLRFEARRDRVARLLGVLSAIGTDPGPLLLLHPTGPLGTARAGMMLAEVTPALEAEVATLRRELQEVADLRAVQAGAADTLARGLTAAQAARTALSQAIAARGPLPRRFNEDPEALALLAESAETLDAFAFGLLPDTGFDEDPLLDFGAAQGTLPLPVLGTVLREAGEADAAGVVRPGLVIGTRPQALVLAPWSGTIRYRGPLLDYGNVMILEPGPGYLLVLAGLGVVYGDVGEVVAKGAPLGLMGGAPEAAAEFGVDAGTGSGAGGGGTLYLEVRQGGSPVDPGEWFAFRQE